MVVDYPHALVANPNVAAANAKELVALAKARPGQLNFASGGNGATNHVSGAMFNQAAGVDITHVPYKGNGPAIVDLLADRVQRLFTSTGPVEAHRKGGNLNVGSPDDMAALLRSETVRWTKLAKDANIKLD